jgi:hypothetical protein
MTTRRLPAPWSVEKMPGGYLVRDITGQALAYVYSRANVAEAMQAQVLTEDEARRIAANIPLRPRSGSTPHDAVIADPPPHRHPPLRPALARQHPRLPRSARLARGHIANSVQQRAIRSFAPAHTPKIRAKAIRPPASA